ncbi:hypothetical protein EKL30_02365 [Candidimonas sp. SYP-B2681]|nr:hypothetical protein EKL30_02365 [Candidimonas sp. SYP-B2681]
MKAQPLRATKAVRRRGAANDDSASNPCLSCGACCAHFRVSLYCREIAGEAGGSVPPVPNPDCQRLRKAIGLPLLAPREDDNDDDLEPTDDPPCHDDVAA